MKNKYTLYTRSVKQRKEAPDLVMWFYWDSIGTHAWAMKEIRAWYKSARRILNLSTYQARTYTFGRMVELNILSIRKLGEEDDAS